MEFQRESKEHIREQVKSLRDRVIQSHQQLREARLEHEQAKKEHDENVQALGQALAQLKTCQEILLRANTDFIEKNRFKQKNCFIYYSFLFSLFILKVQHCF